MQGLLHLSSKTTHLSWFLSLREPLRMKKNALLPLLMMMTESMKEMAREEAALSKGLGKKVNLLF